MVQRMRSPAEPDGIDGEVSHLSGDEVNLVQAGIFGR